MMLVLRDGCSTAEVALLEALAARLSTKLTRDGLRAARGPVVSDADDAPLASLGDGDKLHVVARGTGRSTADRANAGGAPSMGGHTPGSLVARLHALGLPRAARLRQLHLVADGAGAEGDQSFAQRFADALVVDGFAVLEVKAPCGRIEAAADGAIVVHPDDDAALGADGKVVFHHYAGPGVQAKHRR